MIEILLNVLVVIAVIFWGIRRGKRAKKTILERYPDANFEEQFFFSPGLPYPGKMREEIWQFHILHGFRGLAVVVVVFFLMPYLSVLADLIEPVLAGLFEDEIRDTCLTNWHRCFQR
ncbi:MAG: hypothetical protein AAGE61_21335 [Pseudomonadota bacterium]